MDVALPAPCVVCAHVVMEVNVIQSSDSLTHWYRGVYHIQVTDTITGLVCTEDSSGMDSSLQLSLTLSLWVNRSVHSGDGSYTDGLPIYRTQ